LTKQRKQQSLKDTILINPSQLSSYKRKMAAIAAEKAAAALLGGDGVVADPKPLAGLSPEPTKEKKPKKEK
jgi:hypothetical protein